MKFQHQYATGSAAHSSGNGMRAIADFGRGALAAAAVSSLLPYEAFDGALRLNLIVSVCLGFLLFRMALRGKALPGALGWLSLAAGGGLMSFGRYMDAAQQAGAVVLAGTAIFLFGLSILIRAPRPSSVVSREGIEDIPGGVGMREKAPSSDEGDLSEDLAELANGVGLANPVDLPSTTTTQAPAKKETIWHQFAER